MLRFDALCITVLCCAVLCCVAPCCAVLCCAVLCCAVLCCAVLRYAALRRAVLCCAVLCCAALRCSVLGCAVLPAVMYQGPVWFEWHHSYYGSTDSFHKILRRRLRRVFGLWLDDSSASERTNPVCWAPSCGRARLPQLHEAQAIPESQARNTRGNSKLLALQECSLAFSGFHNKSKATEGEVVKPVPLLSFPPPSPQHFLVPVLLPNELNPTLSGKQWKHWQCRPTRMRNKISRRTASKEHSRVWTRFAAVQGPQRVWSTLLVVRGFVIFIALIYPLFIVFTPDVYGAKFLRVRLERHDTRATAASYRSQTRGGGDGGWVPKNARSTWLVVSWCANHHHTTFFCVDSFLAWLLVLEVGRLVPLIACVYLLIRPVCLFFLQSFVRPFHCFFLPSFFVPSLVLWVSSTFVSSSFVCSLSRPFGVPNSPFV